MSDYKENVNSLRGHADLIEKSGAEVYGPSATRLLVYDLRNAADAIEALQHELNVQKNMLENLLMSSTESLIPKRGEWIGRQNHKKCSVCGVQAIYDVALQTDMKTPYCPHCGAKMEVQE